VTDTNDKWSHILGEGGSSGWYATMARKELYSSERAAALHRTITVGDCVWGLHGGGIMWLPALVTAVYENDDVAGISYDLSYFMSQQELQQSRIVASTRQLILLPSDAVTPVQTQNFADERSLCDRIFDLINIDKLQTVSASVILDTLKSKVMEKLVTSSVALSMIAFGSAPSQSCAPSPTTFPLADALLFQFPNGISKVEFLGFTEYALDLHSFNKVTTHIPKSVLTLNPFFHFQQ
jgi:hypothetical protein